MVKKKKKKKKEQRELREKKSRMNELKIDWHTDIGIK